MKPRVIAGDAREFPNARDEAALAALSGVEHQALDAQPVEDRILHIHAAAAPAQGPQAPRLTA